jgi:uncharacterized lipoprotein YddW (UPF0748 family)
VQRAFFCVLTVIVGGLISACPPDANDASQQSIPEPPREFRGAWVATVANIDWPSTPGLPTERQRAELSAIIDRAAQLHLNVIIFQVRPACDALYVSQLEPWSAFLTGQQGRVPEPAYDPLEFAVHEAHKRGIELHAWFNPYRARHFEDKSPAAETHISKTRPELVRPYGRYLWLDPGEPAVQEYSQRVILDVVRRYDIDAVHLDDYFYPYPERDAAGKPIDFPDGSSWERYVQSGGKLARDDWRRENINTFIERLDRAIKKEKPWVKFGISPFGIWRPGCPEQIKGFDAYANLYADSRAWLVNGWVDYFVPQLYWPIAEPAQSYPALLRWWVGQNTRGRQLIAGNHTSKIADGSKRPWRAEEIIDQIRLTRGESGASGNVHFSMKALMENRDGIADALQKDAYAAPALVPATLWLDKSAVASPTVTTRHEPDGRVTVSWVSNSTKPVWLWVVSVRRNNTWTHEIFPWQQSYCTVASAEAIAVRAIDRCGNASEPACP